RPRMTLEQGRCRGGPRPPRGMRGGRATFRSDPSKLTAYERDPRPRARSATSGRAPLDGRCGRRPGHEGAQECEGVAYLFVAESCLRLRPRRCGTIEGGELQPRTLAMQRHLHPVEAIDRGDQRGALSRPVTPAGGERRLDGCRAWRAARDGGTREQAGLALRAPLEPLGSPRPQRVRR